MRPTYDTSDPVEYIKSNMSMLIETRVLFGMLRIETDSKEFLQKAVRDRNMVDQLMEHYEMLHDGSYCVCLYVKPFSAPNFTELRWTITPNPVKFEEITL